MRILTLTVLLSLVAPGPFVAEPPASSEILPTKLERISELLATAERKFREREYEASADLEREALRLAARLEPELLQPTGSINDQKARAQLLLELGQTAYIRNQDTVAQRYLETSLKLFQETSGRQEPKVADVLMKLADLHLSHDRPELWQTSLDRALKIRLDVYGPNHPDVAWVWTLRGTHAEADGDLAAAEEYFRRAVTALEKSQPPTAQELGFAYRELGRVLKARGQVERAAELEEKARQILAQYW